LKVYIGRLDFFAFSSSPYAAGFNTRMGPVATQGGFVAAVENTAPSPGGAAGTGSESP